MPTHDRVSFKLGVNETKHVVLYAGRRARARWSAQASFLGKPVSNLQLECPALDGCDPCVAWTHGDEKVCTADLPPREYRVTVLDLPELRLSLAPGEHRKDSFEIPARNVVVTADAALCAMLDPNEYGVSLALNGSPDYGLLNLLGLEPLPAQSCLLEFALGLRQPDLEAEADRRWQYTIPPGVYEWVLSGGTRNLKGILDLRGRGDARIDLSFCNLPGLGLLEVPCRNFSEEDRPEVDFPAAFPDIGNTLVMDARQGVFSSTSRQFFDEQRNTWMVFAPRGRALLRVEQREFSYYRQVQVPGVLNLAPLPGATLRVENDESERTLCGVATCNGLIVPLDALGLSYDSVTCLPAGTWLLHLRSEHKDSEGNIVREFAQTWMTLGVARTELPVSRFPWRTCGEATLRLKSRRATTATPDTSLLTALSLELDALGVFLSLGSDKPACEGDSVTWTFKGLPEGHHRVVIATGGVPRAIEFYVEAGQCLELKP